MTTRGRRRFSSRGGQKRQNEWDTIITEPTLVGAGAQGIVDLMSGFHANDRKGMTLVRMIGQIGIAPTGAGDQVEFAAGITIMEADAAAAGAYPDPSSDNLHPWLWWVRDAPFRESGSTRNILYPIDVKGMRRLRSSADSFYLIVENDDSAHTLTLTVGFRMLYKLS